MCCGDSIKRGGREEGRTVSVMDLMHLQAFLHLAVVHTMLSAVQKFRLAVKYFPAGKSNPTLKERFIIYVTNISRPDDPPSRTELKYHLARLSIHPSKFDGPHFDMTQKTRVDRQSFMRFPSLSSLSVKGERQTKRNSQHERHKSCCVAMTREISPARVGGRIQRDGKEGMQEWIKVDQGT